MLFSIIVYIKYINYIFNILKSEINVIYREYKYFIYKKNRKIIEMFYYIMKKLKLKNENEILYC